MDLEKIKILIEPTINECNLSLYDIEMTQEFGDDALTVLVDSESGILDLETILDVSDKVSKVMDENEKMFKDPYTLIVASAGAERPIKARDQYEKSLNKHINVTLHEEINSRIVFEGELIYVDESVIKIEYRDKTRLKEVEVNFENIKAARTAVKF